MAVPRLHEDQIDVPDALVARLVAQQFPHWSALPLQHLPSAGTINRVDALGDHLVVRMPFIDWGARDVDRDEELLPVLRKALPVAVPTLVARGEPAPGMPWAWGVYERLDGRHPDPGADDGLVSEALVEVIRALRAMPIDGPASPAVFAFADDDAQTRPRVEALDSPGASAAWDTAVAAPPWYGDGSWIHGDLVPGNLMLSGDPARLSAVIDWAASGVGDPAFDLLPAWTLMGSAARARFLEALDATDDEVARARGYAVRKIAWGLPYYRDSLPVFADTMKHALREIEADFSTG